MVVPHSRFRETGRVTIDEDTCKQCGQCAAICPADVLFLDDERVHVRDDTPFGCIACGHCMMVCPDGSITVTGRGISPDDLIPLPARENVASADATGRPDAIAAQCAPLQGPGSGRQRCCSRLLTWRRPRPWAYRPGMWAV